MNRVLNFHQVSNLSWFDNLICILKSKYDFITVDSLNEFYAGRINLDNACLLTMDDGEKSFYEIIFPVLKKYNVPAFICVSPKICKECSNYWFQEINGYDQTELKRIIADLLNVSVQSIKRYNSEWILKTLTIQQINEIIKRYQTKTNTPVKVFQNMTVKNLREVEQSGLVTIGAHTLNHPILRNEDDFTIGYEISESINQLSDLLGHEIKYFVYPNGIPELDFTEREERFLRNTGILLTFTTEPGILSLSDSRTRIPRFGIADLESNYKINTKMLLSSQWNALTKLNPFGEYHVRKQLARIIIS